MSNRTRLYLVGFLALALAFAAQWFWTDLVPEHPIWKVPVFLGTYFIVALPGRRLAGVERLAPYSDPPAALKL